MNARLDSMAHFSILNCKRALRWHPQGLQSWSMSDWFTALAGEVGEVGNVIKKLNRVRDGLIGNKETPEQLKQMLAHELADVYIYLDLCAQAAGIDFPTAIVEKFNATSDKLGLPDRF
jgi:NTP pyrophosphatase (non-canonical NTP hydrolase)